MIIDDSAKKWIVIGGIAGAAAMLGTGVIFFLIHRMEKELRR